MSSSSHLCLWRYDTPVVCIDDAFLCMAMAAFAIAAIVLIVALGVVAEVRKTISSASDFEPLKMTPGELMRVLESTRPDLSERDRAAWAGRAGKSIFEQQASKARGGDSAH